MNESFIDYLQRLELIAFFSGYPMLYAAVFTITGNLKRVNHWKQRVTALLPYSYALVSTLYLVFKLNNLYPRYTNGNLQSITTHSFLQMWALAALLFWIS